MTAIGFLTRRYLADYVRRPVNVFLLVVIPLVFVVLYADAMARMSRILGGSSDADAVLRSTVGWAAAFLAGVSAFFQAAGARDADRRLADSGFAVRNIVAARLASSGVLALVAVAASSIAYLLRNGTNGAVRAASVGLLFAIVYIAIGTIVGRLIHDDLNGSVVVMFVWILDIFLGPVVVGNEAAITRLAPTHFASLVVADMPENHGGPFGDLGAALLWVFGGLVFATWLFSHGLRAARSPRNRRSDVLSPAVTSRSSVTTSTRSVSPAPSALGATRLIAGLHAALLDWSRNRVLWLLVAVVPLVFITLAIAATPDEPISIRLVEHGRRATQIISMVDTHAASMAPLAVAALAGLAGMFVALGSQDADRRLVLCGFRPRHVLLSRFGVLVVVAIAVTAVAVGVTALQFRPQQWLPFAFATLLLAALYGVIGAILGPLVGRVGGVYLLFLIPFIDLGMGQSPMLNAAPPSWADLLPGHGPSRVLYDTALTQAFDEWTSLAVGLLWLAGLVAVCAWRFDPPTTQAFPTATDGSHPQKKVLQ